MKKILVFVPVLVIVACTGYNFDFQTKETKSFSAPLFDSLAIESENGGVEAWTSTDTVVSLQITKRVSGKDEADAEAHVSDIVVTFTEDTAHRWLRVKADMPSGVGRSYGADFAVSLPERYGCNFLSSNGSLRVHAVKGPLFLETSNGTVEAENSRGPVFMKTSNGGIRVLFHSGGLSAKTSNGEINTDIVLLDAGEVVSLESSNGGIVVSLPADVSAAIDAETSNGHISVSGFSITVDELTENHIKGKIGSGAATVKVKTSNGNVTIMKR